MYSRYSDRKSSRAMFLDLPVELRLRIAEYALEQRPAAGIPHIGRHLQDYRGGYRSSEDMALLFVCRQFRTDFTQLVYNKIRFLIGTQKQATGLQELPLPRLRSIRRLAYIASPRVMESWGSYFYDLEHLRLDELVFLWDNWFRYHVKELPSFMRRLKHVRVAKFVLYGMETYNRSEYCALVGAMMKEDHYQRYDAPGAPNVEATWWDWSLNATANVITFKAHDPRPVLPEEEYMLLMKPKVDALMTEAERAARTERGAYAYMVQAANTGPGASHIFPYLPDAWKFS